jgi:hypothetical protein
MNIRQRDQLELALKMLQFVRDIVDPVMREERAANPTIAHHLESSVEHLGEAMAKIRLAKERRNSERHPTS